MILCPDADFESFEKVGNSFNRKKFEVENLLHAVFQDQKLKRVANSPEKKNVL